MEATYKRVLHKAQKQFFKDQHRFRVLVAGRRFGKSRLILDELIRASLEFDGDMSPTSPQLVIGTLPTAVQARGILWKPLVNIFTETDLKHVVKNINLSSMTIDIEGKPSITILGANDRNGDRIRGKRIYFIAIDEAQDTNPVTWQDVIRPALSDTVGSKAMMSGTPKGRVNFLHDLAMMENEFPNEWKFFNFPTSTNPTIPREEIEQARASLPPRVFEQEYSANFVNFKGQIWTELDQANICQPDDVPPCDLHVLGVDLGDRHPAAVVCGRDSRSMTWYLKEAWSPNTSGGESQPVTRAMFELAIRYLVEKYNVDLTFVDPSRPSDILAIRDYGQTKGYQNAVAAFNPIESGVAQVSNLIHQNKLIVVDSTPSDYHKSIGFLSGQQTYDFMLSYHWVTDKRGDITEEPADGSFSHVCDSLRYALAYKGG